MPGEVDAFDVQAGAPRHLHVDQRQRDRNPRAAIEHFVQEAVARVFVVHFVADEAHLAEQIPVQRHHLRVSIGIDIRRRVAGRGRRVGDAAPRLAADVIELFEIGTCVERRVSIRAIISAATARSGSGLSAAEVKLRTSWGRITDLRITKKAQARRPVPSVRPGPGYQLAFAAFCVRGFYECRAARASTDPETRGSR